MADIAAIKDRLSIHDVADRLGLEVPRRGDALCPRHKGHALRLKDHYFYCHGGCASEGGKGDIFNLVMFAEGVDFAAALEQCAAWAGVTIERSPAAQQQAKRQRAVEDVLEFAAAFYRLHYAQSPAQTYAEGRGWADIADEAEFGYAPPGWDHLTKALTKEGVDLDLAVEAGVVKPSEKRKGNYYDSFRNRIVFPARQRGRVVYLQARALSDADAPKYLNVGRADPPLYHVNGALTSPRPALVESTSDALTLTAAQVPALSSYGVTLRPAQAAALRRFEVVYVGVQNDAAGATLADNAAQALGEKVRIAAPPKEHKGWDEATKAGVPWQPDDRLTWLRWKVQQIAPSGDHLADRKALEPVFAYLAGLDDDATLITYLDELRARYAWPRGLFTQYQAQIKQRRQQAQAAQRPDEADVEAETDELGESLPPPTFISPALAAHGGVVYVAQMMSFKARTKTRKHGVVESAVWRPVIISSERRRLLPEPPPEGAPEGALTYLDKASNLALRGGFSEAAEGRWSYESIVAFLNGTSPAVQAHEVYDALLQSLRQYVYHADDDSYVVDVLWAMGTYFHQLFNAFPYLALHGHKGAGKTTLLTWLGAVCFNASSVVNTSEASLYRSIQAKAPTMLIDEQEGLNSKQAARENKADLMGILKSGYKRGMTVARQRLDRPDITEHFEVYSPKALAAIEHFEDVLENRAILTFMKEKPRNVELMESERINTHDADEFAPLRDRLYLLLMAQAGNVVRIADRVSSGLDNRFRELFKPLFALAALVDLSRDPTGKSRIVVAAIERAASAKLELRKQRDNLTEEARLREAIRIVCDQAERGEEDGPRVDHRGYVLADSLHLRDAFISTYSTPDQAFSGFDVWLGKQVQKMDGITDAGRHTRKVKAYDPVEREATWTPRKLTRYQIDPKAFAE